jgi:thiamine transport system ATP-binding protein
MLELADVSVRVGDRAVLHGIDFGVAGGEIVSVLGPSGSGKTTLLRVIAGLERPSGGHVLWDGRDLLDVPVHERGFGLMFQDYALFPHRNVFDNVAFGLRMGDRAKRERAAVGARVAEVLALVGLTGLEGRSVARLSGGEQQRVALARTLAPAPRLLMLDEPLGSLDRALRERLPMELRAIFERVAATVLYVTHDQEEALGVADRTIVLRDGRMEADAAPHDLWQRPPTEFVARFLGFENIAPASIVGDVARTPWGDVPLGRSSGDPDVARGTARGRSAAADVRDPQGPPNGGAERLVLLRPEAFAPDPSGPIRGTIVTRTFRGDHMRLRVAVDGAPPLELDARWDALPGVGDPVALRVEPRGVVLLPRPV